MQLPLAHSGWLFKEEVTEQDDTKPWLPKEEKMELDPPAVKGALGWGVNPAKWGWGGSPFPVPTGRLSPVKEEPCDEDPQAEPAQIKGPPGFPRDVSVAELLQRLSLSPEEELLFLQLPDTLPGQPPTHDTKPIKTELQNEEGQVVVVKQEKSQVGAPGGGCGTVG